MGIFDFLKNKVKLIDYQSEKTVLPNKEELKTNLDKIQNDIFQFLKPLGFKNKGRTFNRETENGIYQVINIQSGQVYSTLYGSFTINVGVMVKEIYELKNHNKPKVIYQDYDCQIRERLSQLTIKNDFWWKLSAETGTTSKVIIEGLNTKGIKWLNDLGSRENIVNNWLIMSDNNSPRAELDVAIITLKLDTEKGIALFRKYYKKIKSENPHKNYLKELAIKLCIEID